MSIQYVDLLDIDECRDNEVNYYLTEYEFFCPADPILKERREYTTNIGISSLIVAMKLPIITNITKENI